MVNILIRKQLFSVKVSGEQQAFNIRETLSGSVQTAFQDMLERLFQSSLSSDSYLVFEKLQVDMGRLPEEGFEKHFTALLETKLLAELKKQLFQSPQMGSAEVSDFSIKVSSDIEGDFNALCCFLETGLYPWWYQSPDLKMPQQLIGNLAARDIERFILRIISVYKNDPDRAGRITDRLFIHVGSRAEALVEAFIKFFNSTAKINLQNLLKNRDELINSCAIPVQDFYKQLFYFLLAADIDNEKNLMQKFILELQEFKNKWGGIKERKSSQEKNRVKKEEQGGLLTREDVYITNAGLILLHPFLQPLFLTLGLIDSQNQFKTMGAAKKATVLLYYLQNGTLEYIEWEMAFNKIICGLQLDEVIPENIILSGYEMQECNTLLQTVADYWEALKGASVEALQNTFLIRPGKIVWREGYWLLQVERTGVDVLLERLPWSFNTVKLPWLETLIYTEW
ncbi:contractile injection system tape measure protein [Rubrolithibacter danxiaensis]|uniref:contractile injection system tape measure protein n=1 Tax=Rubrolithibacter danxiaensis TaxID=3390805 RepID=UPI003BF8E178